MTRTASTPLGRRVRALDALYLNADRRWQDYIAAPTAENEERHRRAREAYDALVNLPYPEQEQEAQP